MFPFSLGHPVILVIQIPFVTVTSSFVSLNEDSITDRMAGERDSLVDHSKQYCLKKKNCLYFSKFRQWIPTNEAGPIKAEN